VLPIVVEHAGKMSHADFQRLLCHWERIADVDGAHRDADRSHRRRRASWGVDDVGDFDLRLRCGPAQGVQVRAVVDMFARVEFDADWVVCVAEHGDAAVPGLMRRDDAQRRADAIVAMANVAASTPPGAQAPQPLVNIIVDHTTLTEFIHRRTGDIDHRDDLDRDGGVDPAFARDVHSDLDPADGVDLARRHSGGGGGGGGGCDGGLDHDKVGVRPAAGGPWGWRGCSSVDGDPLPVADAVAAMFTGRIRVVITNEHRVVLRMGRTQRLFTGKLREAVMLAAHECVWNGCNRPTSNCQADHLTDWQHHGHTDIDNGAPICAHHNRFKNHGYRIHRDNTGHWHTYRPDNTEI
jgi:hypothetical protein